MYYYAAAGLYSISSDVAYIGIFVRELRVIACRGGSSVHIAVLFTVIVGTAMFVLPHDAIDGVVPSLFWVCGVSIMQVSIREIFDEDYRSGVLEQMLIQDVMPEVIVCLKILAHWASIAVPISLVAMFLSFVVLNSGIHDIAILGAALCTGFLVVNFISAVGHALVLDGDGSLVIAQVLIFPVIVPVVVYCNLLMQILQGQIEADHMYAIVLLGAGIVSIIPISIFFILSGIKLAVEQN